MLQVALVCVIEQHYATEPLLAITDKVICIARLYLDISGHGCWILDTRQLFDINSRNVHRGGTTEVCCAFMEYCS